MVHCCNVFGCSNRSDREKDRYFHRLPKIRTHLDEETKDLSAGRRSRWLSNIRRADLAGEKLVWVWCNHFVTGKPAALFQKFHPDWAPTLRLGHSNIKEESVSRWERRKERSEKRPSSQIEGLGQHTSVVHQYCLDVIAPSTSDELENHDEEISSSSAFILTEVQKELSMGGIEQKLPALENENTSLKEKIISMIPIDIAKLEQDKEMVLFLTSLSNYLMLISLFSFLSESVSHTPKLFNLLSRVLAYYDETTIKPAIPGICLPL